MKINELLGSSNKNDLSMKKEQVGKVTDDKKSLFQNKIDEKEAISKLSKMSSDEMGKLEKKDESKNSSLVKGSETNRSLEKLIGSVGNDGLIDEKSVEILGLLMGVAKNELTNIDKKSVFKYMGLKDMKKIEDKIDFFVKKISQLMKSYSKEANKENLVTKNNMKMDKVLDGKMFKKMEEMFEFLTSEVKDKTAFGEFAEMVEQPLKNAEEIVKILARLKESLEEMGKELGIEKQHIVSGKINLYEDNRIIENINHDSDAKVENANSGSVGLEKEVKTNKLSESDVLKEMNKNVDFKKETKPNKLSETDVSKEIKQKLEEVVNAREVDSDKDDKAKLSPIQDKDMTQIDTKHNKDETKGMEKANKLPEFTIDQLKDKAKEKIDEIQKMVAKKDKILVQLKPESLGKVELFFKKTANGIEISIDLENGSSKQKVELLLDDLKRDLKDKNIEVNFDFRDKNGEKGDKEKESERKNGYEYLERNEEEDNQNNSFEDFMKEVLEEVN